MTLLIGTVARASTTAKSHIVLTADGRCTGTQGTKRTTLSNTYQKLYPLPGRPVAFAHHGENVIIGRPVQEALTALLEAESQRVDSSDVHGLAALLVEAFHEPSLQTFRFVPDAKVIAFWIAGFDPSKKHPVLHEVCWERNVDTGEICLKEEDHGNLVFGGDGKRLIDQYTDRPVDGMYDWKKIPDQGIKYAQKFHAKLYRLAEEAQAKGPFELFGGHKHQIVVTQRTWEWSIPPSEV